MLDWNPQLAPLTYFSTAAGPSMSDLIGPSAGVLNIYADGEPVAASESAIANNVGSGTGKWWRRADLWALIWMILGGAMIHMYLRAE